MNRQELAKRLAEISVLRGDFTLRSGHKSSYYLDKYLFSTQPDVLGPLAEMFATHVSDDVTRLAGAELGGIALVVATSLVVKKPCIFIRNQKKDYGTAKQLEGALEKGDKVMLVEDICTTGGQVLEAARVIEEAGANIAKIVGTIDRLEGARKNIEGAGYVFESLFTTEDLLI